MPQTATILRNRRSRRDAERHAREGRLRFGGLSLGMLLSLLLAAVIFLVALAYASLTSSFPNVDLLPALLNPPDGLLLQPTQIFDRSGQHPLWTFAPSDSPRRYLPLNPQSPQHLPDFLAKATVAAADPGFWSEPGYSLSGWQNPDLHPTIAQKIVSGLLLYKEPPSIQRSIRERILAAQITARFGRNQILEWYLNSADYGHDAYGVDAAAQIYFGKPAFELTPAESAVLAAVSQAPSLNPLDAKDVALQNGRKTIQIMQALELISASDASSALAESPSPLSPSEGAVKENVTPAFVNLAISQLEGQFSRERIERGGVKILTTLDYDLQQQAECVTIVYAARLAGSSDPSTPCDAAQRLPSFPPGTTVQELSASAVITDPESGQILAIVGETLKGAETGFLTEHDPGSLMTPFIYLAGFTRGLSPASLEWDIPSSGNVKNLDGQYHGPVRIRIALANDYLVPAVQVEAQMGSDAVNQTESSFGLDPSNSTLLDMASAYGVFAAQGVRYGQPGLTAVLRVEGLDRSTWLDWSNPQAQPVTTPQLAYLVDDVLSDESARWPSLGHPNPLEIGRPAAVKIGQTSDGHDVWTVGSTPTRLVAVWTGSHASNSARLAPQLSSDLWRALILTASQALSSNGWPVPQGITVMDVCDPSGLLPTKDCPNVVSEVFLNGNEPVQFDDLFHTYQVNRETGYLATVFTPPELIEDKVFLQIPPAAQDWAKSAGVPIVPTAYDAIQSPQVNPNVNISSPAMFGNVNGQVQIKGTAAGADFDHYRVMIGQGLNPQQWIQVGSDSTTPVTGGILATWDTSGLNGLYAVQLQVVRSDQSVDMAVTQVTVSNK